MATIIGQINLLKFRNARRVQDGNIKGIFIPIADNPAIFDGGKGCYANIRIVEKASEYNGIKYTHFAALSIAKEEREQLSMTMSEEDLRSLTPIVGNFKEYRNEPQYEKTTLASADDLKKYTTKKEGGDLPF